MADRMLRGFPKAAAAAGLGPEGELREGQKRGQQEGMPLAFETTPLTSEFKVVNLREFIEHLQSFSPCRGPKRRSELGGDLGVLPP